MTSFDRIKVGWTAHAGLAAGAVSISASAVLLSLAAATPASASAARCLLALPVMAICAMFEPQRQGRFSAVDCVSAAVCGALFAGDMLWWTQAIPEVGAGLATVLVNTQVAIVPLLAWLVDHERVRARFLWSLPAILGGVLLAGGVFQHGAGGSDPMSGTIHAILAAVCYSGFLFLLRRGGQRSDRPLQTYTVVLATAAIVALAVGLLGNSLMFTFGWSTAGWLALATITGQLLGWLLVAFCSPKLPSDVSSALLLLTPIGAMLFGVVVLAERPSPLQLAGCALVLVASYLGTAHP